MDKNSILNLKIIEEYKKVARDMLQHSFSLLSKSEIEEALDYSILKRIENSEASIDNNYKNKKINTTLLQISEYIMNREPIITPYGVMFAKHGEVPNPIANLLKTFMDNRDMHKQQMFQYPKGSEMFEKYNLLQLLDKIDANGFK